MLKPIVATLVLAVAFSPLAMADTEQEIVGVPYFVPAGETRTFDAPWNDVELEQLQGEAFRSPAPPLTVLSGFAITCTSEEHCIGLMVQA